MKVSLFNNYFIIFISLLFSLTSEADIYYNHTSSDENLYFVFSTYRHGARTTYYNPDYFGNPNPNPTALTPYGALQHLQIGQRYRERYANFLNLNFDPKQMYVRSSDSERVLISTLKELEGLFGRVIGKEYVDVINAGHNFWNLFQLNDTEHQELDKYLNYCNNKKRRRLPNINQIFPILKECFGKDRAPNPAVFCDNVFSAYHDYAYGNDSENNIGKCGREKADKMFEFCINHSNGGRGWDEKAAYMFYILFQNLFKYMFNAIEGTSDLKMVMIGGHDITLAPFMDFLSGLKIVPRNIYPFYAFNIVFELRKYSDEFYIEIYYIDVLKYNETLETFMDTLDNSKYSNLYNMCGLPPWKEEIITIEDVQKETAEEIKEEILSTQKFENITTSELIHPTNLVEEPSKNQKNFPSQHIDTTKKNEILPTEKLEIEGSNKKAKLPELYDTIIKETNNKDELIKNTSIIEDIPSTKKIEIKKINEKEEISNSQKIVIEETTEKEEINITQKIEMQKTIEKEEIITSQKIEEEINEKEKISTTQKIEEKETTEREKIITSQKIEEKETKEKEEISTTQKIEEETNEKEEISTTQKVEIQKTTEKEIPSTNKIYIEIPSTQKIQKIEIEESNKNEEIPTTQKMEIQETTKKEEIPSTIKIEETNKNELIPNTQIPKKETEKVEEVKTESITNKEEKTEEKEETENNLEPLDNLTNIIQAQEMMQSNSTFQRAKTKLKKFFKQEKDLNLYIILISIVFCIVAIIFFVFLFRCLAKKKRKFIRLNEEQSKDRENNVNNNLNVLSVENSKR